MNRRWFFALLGWAAPLLPAQPQLALKQHALQSPVAYQLLQELTDTIGPRLTGSAQEVRAGAWAMAAMRRLGLQNVHAEPWPLERAWTRGHARAQLLQPFPLELTIAARGWTGSTAGGARVAPVIAIDSGRLAEELKQHHTAWTGKILLLMPQHAAGADSFPLLPQLLTAASQAGAVAILEADSRPGLMLAHAGPVSNSARPFPLPCATLAAAHAQLLARLLRSGVPVQLRIDIQNQFSPGPVVSQNIVGEIPGAENPEEVILLGAHLDSWDQGTGAIDDGFGVAAVLSAAHSLLAAGGQPRRTIRVVLFTGEEQGLLGSRAYVARHQTELAQMVCAIVLDWGAGPITKFLLAGHEEFAPPLQTLFPAIADVLPLQVGRGYTTYTDAFPFILAGVPAVSPFQNSADYQLVGHSAADTLDQVEPATLTRDAAALALTVHWIANYPVRLGARWPPERTAEMLAGQRTVLQQLGYWPF